jgi:HAD superfamily hydrolase (TIGR01549 family)
MSSERRPLSFEFLLEQTFFKMKNIILFDFDGTLADTFDALVKITNNLAGEYGYPTVNQSEAYQLKNLSSWQIIKRSGLSVFQLPFLVQRIRSELRDQLETIDLFPGIRDALFRLKQQGYSLYILTSNSQDNVNLFIQKHQIADLFSGVYSSSNLFGKHRKIKSILKQENISSHRAIYVGDETRDIVAAKKAKIKAIAVTWGFNDSEVLSQYHPDALIHHPCCLAEAIGEQLKTQPHPICSFPKLMLNSLLD